jgi:endonuclease YncB( thermonuclease family)
MHIKNLLLSLLLLLSTVTPISASSQAGKNFSGTVLKVIDGDSLIVSRGRGRQEIRLYGVDAPEFDQPGSAACKKWMRSHVAGQHVSVLGVNYDRYGRLVAVVKMDGKAVNGLLVEQGLVWVYSRYCHKNICRDWKSAEKQAKLQGRNLWQNPHPIPPWVWRHRNSYHHK